MSKKKSGLGGDAGSLFQPTGPAAQPEKQAATTPDEEIRERTTITLSLKTRALLDKLKTDARRHGESATHSAIIEAALIEYAKHRNIEA